MKVFVGVDLGSTTSKALILDEHGAILGRGITNSRSNYDVAVEVARSEAFVEARFNLLRGRLDRLASETKSAAVADVARKMASSLVREFRLEQHNQQLRHLEATSFGVLDAERFAPVRTRLRSTLETIFAGMAQTAPKHFRFATPSTEFFRDLASSDFMRLAQENASLDLKFDTVAGVFDKAILVVENGRIDLSFETNIEPAFERVLARHKEDLEDGAVELCTAVKEVVTSVWTVAGNVGTGYGRARLPFPKEQIRSEILCHGLGAHRMFPDTATVLDIGGQDTKAIQLDNQGLVTSFQMNDRCAAGCGRYLGYIADEMNLGLHELGPLAEQSNFPVRINSTCTVFAGAELRDRLTMGQKREDILAGLHRAIILRAMSLLARSGGVKNELTFTGGVAKNAAAVSALRSLVEENYGKITLNISPDSIYTGALGAAMFALRSAETPREAAA